MSGCVGPGRGGWPLPHFLLQLSLEERAHLGRAWEKKPQGESTPCWPGSQEALAWLRTQSQALWE